MQLDFNLKLMNKFLILIVNFCLVLVVTATEYTSVLTGGYKSDHAIGFPVTEPSTVSLAYKWSLGDSIVTSHHDDISTAWFNTTVSPNVTNITMSYPGSDIDEPLNITKYLDLSNTTSYPPGMYGIRVNDTPFITFDGALLVQVISDEQTYQNAWGISVVRSVNNPELQFNGPVRVNTTARWPSNSIEAYSSSLYFYDTLDIWASSRGTNCAIYGATLPSFYFYKAVNIYAKASWSGDNVHGVYCDNVRCLTMFYDTLTIVSDSWSSTTCGIRHQGYSYHYGETSVTINGPRTAYGIWLSHWRAHHRFYAPVSVTSTGGRGTFGDTYGFCNSGTLELYSQTNLWAYNTVSSAAWGIYSTGQIMTNSSTVINATALGSGTEPTYGYGQFGGYTVYLYTVTFYSNSSTNQLSHAVYASNSSIYINAYEDDIVEIEGLLSLAGERPSLHIIWNTPESFWIGATYLPSSGVSYSVFNLTMSNESTWYFQEYQQRYSNSTDNFNLKLDSGSLLTFSNSIIDLSARRPLPFTRYFKSKQYDIAYPPQHVIFDYYTSSKPSLVNITMEDVTMIIGADLLSSTNTDQYSYDRFDLSNIDHYDGEISISNLTIQLSNTTRFNISSLLSSLESDVTTDTNVYSLSLTSNVPYILSVPHTVDLQYTQVSPSFNPEFNFTQNNVTYSTTLWYWPQLAIGEDGNLYLSGIYYQQSTGGDNTIPPSTYSTNPLPTIDENNSASYISYHINIFIIILAILISY